VALYFFHTQSDSRQNDDEGIELASPWEARAQALVTCAQMVKDAPNRFWGTRPWIVTVTDATGLILWELSMDGFAAPAALALEQSSDRPG
jgi:hypothetical protein